MTGTGFRTGAVVPAAMALVAAVLAAAPAFAHSGGTGAAGLALGFAHPLGGLAHVLAMLGVGLCGAHLGGRALWMVPLGFLVFMVAGGVLGSLGVAVPLVEAGIIGSLVVLGVVLAARLRMASWMATSVVAAFALVHGHAHGAEMPAAASGFVYAAGFVLATALLHAAGAGFGSVSLLRRDVLPRLAGAGIAAAGVALALG